MEPIRTKNNMCTVVELYIPNTEAYIINGPVAVRMVQRRHRQLACVATVIDAAKLDTGLVVRACGFEVQGEA